MAFLVRYAGHAARTPKASSVGAPEASSGPTGQLLRSTTAWYAPTASMDGALEPGQASSCASVQGLPGWSGAPLFSVSEGSASRQCSKRIEGWILVRDEFIRPRTDHHRNRGLRSCLRTRGCAVSARPSVPRAFRDERGQNSVARKTTPETCAERNPNQTLKNPRQTLNKP